MQKSYMIEQKKHSFCLIQSKDKKGNNVEIFSANIYTCYFFGTKDFLQNSSKNNRKA